MTSASRDISAFCRKSIFLWHANAVANGNPAGIAALLTGAGFESVILHVEHLSLFSARFSRALIETLRAAGLVILGGAAVYGDAPQTEGQLAAQIVNAYHLDGFVFDAEAKFERVEHPDSAAAHVMLNYQSRCDQPSAWCSWAFYFSESGVPWHVVRVMQTAMRYADVGMPMVYWSWGDSPNQAVAYLDASLNQWRKYTDKPIIPAGRAYLGDGGTARPDAVTAFAARAIEAGCPGVTYWSLQHAINALALPGVWDALSRTPGYTAKQEEYKTFLPVIKKA
jgi:hypothetical protein